MLPRWAARSKQMLTFEDVTGYFLKAAANLDLVTHPEYWVNSRSLEREFACTCHTGSCEEGRPAVLAHFLLPGVRWTRRFRWKAPLEYVTFSTSPTSIVHTCIPGISRRWRLILHTRRRSTGMVRLIRLCCH